MSSKINCAYHVDPQTVHLQLLVSVGTDPAQFKSLCTSLRALVESQKAINSARPQDRTYLTISSFSSVVKNYLEYLNLQEEEGEIFPAIEQMKNDIHEETGETKLDEVLNYASEKFRIFKQDYPASRSVLVLLTGEQNFAETKAVVQLLKVQDVFILGIGLKLEPVQLSALDACCDRKPLNYDSFDFKKECDAINLIDSDLELMAAHLKSSLKITMKSTQVSSSDNIDCTLTFQNVSQEVLTPLTFEVDPKRNTFFAPLSVKMPELAPGAVIEREISFKNLGRPASEFPLAVYFTVSSCNGTTTVLPVRLQVSFPPHLLNDDIIFSERRNILLLGAPRSGKSSFANCLHTLASPSEEVISTAPVAAGLTHCTLDYTFYSIDQLNLRLYDLWGFTNTEGQNAGAFNKVPVHHFVSGRVPLDTNMKDLEKVQEKIKSSQITVNAEQIIDFVIMVVPYSMLQESKDAPENQLLVDGLKSLQKKVQDDGSRTRPVPYLLLITGADDITSEPRSVVEARARDYFLLGQEAVLFHENYTNQQKRVPHIDQSTREVLFYIKTKLQAAASGIPKICVQWGNNNVRQVPLPEQSTLLGPWVQKLFMEHCKSLCLPGKFCLAGKKERKGQKETSWFNYYDYNSLVLSHFKEDQVLQLHWTSKPAPFCPDYWSMEPEGLELKQYQDDEINSDEEP